MVKTNKDLVFWSVLIVWLSLAVVSLFIDNFALIYVHNFFIIVMCILVLIKDNNKKFNNWLNKER